MGSTSAMNSLNRVLEKHGDELLRELEEQMPRECKELGVRVALENNLYHLTVSYLFPSGDVLTGKELDIDTLGERFQDCEVGY